MIAALNRLVELIESRPDAPDVTHLARELGTTEYHLRRMFSSLAGMPLSDYVRRRRMTLAAAEVIRGEGDLLTIAVRYGYGSTEAFGRAFRAVHGIVPAAARENGGPLRTQPQLRFRLSVEGTTPMHTRITDRPGFRLVGHSARVALVHRGANPQIQDLIARIPPEAHAHLKALSSTEPHGLLQVSADVDPDYREGSGLTYLHGVAIAADTAVPAELDHIDVEPGTWAVFRTAGAYPGALQDTWAATATDWFPSNPWRLRPGPSIVAVLERAADFSTATTELWLPVEPSAG
ncbi:AraC family transcriptional regulator [Microbacterium gorillae]|uniref:AraC family transcriptional regulator n=1 Tax=Microbacterium gorillae TaxID=1231063 RepID=UPI00058DF51C|nr:GyrI-like domain-containing protein [Microbacterium gorillae]